VQRNASDRRSETTDADEDDHLLEAVRSPFGSVSEKEKSASGGGKEKRREKRDVRLRRSVGVVEVLAEQRKNQTRDSPNDTQEAKDQSRRLRVASDFFR
jgi:hypothetical protein